MINTLNEKQRIAATTFNGPLIILAGAGSGKTKTITVRAAHMVNSGIDPNSILVLTFTNKAATEMRERGRAISDNSAEFSTFHSWCFKFLKNTYKDNLTIIDTPTSERAIGVFIPEFFSEDRKIKGKDVAAIFGILENNLILNDDPDIYEKFKKILKTPMNAKIFSDNGFAFQDIEHLIKLYKKYKEDLRDRNLLDFNDLITLTIKIISESEDIKNALRSKYQYIMVDEFQDTNYAQIFLLDLLTNEKQNICVVGDDSQSIYGWRGADIGFILNFHKKFKNCTVVNLSTNYRSTPEVVKKANIVLDTATEKHEFKEKLNAYNNHEGENKVVDCSSEPDFIVEKIKEIGGDYSEIAILYRTKILLKSIEQALLQANIPYVIHQGKNFLEKKVIRELMSYLSLMINRENIYALENILLLTKSLSKVKAELFVNHYKGDVIKGFEKIESLDFDIKLTGPQKERRAYFLERFERDCKLSYEDLIESLTDDNSIVYGEYNELVKKGTTDDKVKEGVRACEDIEMMVNIMKDYKNLNEFIEDIILKMDTTEDSSEKVNLMTIHASKGLEFETVFVIGNNTDIFPGPKASSSFEALEEERRLFYVAITRAKTNLYLTYRRSLFGKELRPSRFLKETGFINNKIVYDKKVPFKNQYNNQSKKRWY